MFSNFFILLYLILLDSGSESCLTGDGTLPLFAPSSRVNNRDFSKDQLILAPALSFSCAAQVTGWQAYMERAGTYSIIIFQVWRPVAGSTCSYELVGNHTVHDYVTGDNLLVITSTLDLNFAPIIVQPGDIVAVYVSHAQNRQLNFQVYRGYSPTADTYRLSISVASIPMQTTFSCNDAGVSTRPSVPIVTAIVEAFPTTLPPPITTPQPPMTTPLPAVTTPPPAKTTPPLTMTTPPPAMTTPPPAMTTPPPAMTTPPPEGTTPPPAMTTPPLTMTTPPPAITMPLQATTTPLQQSPSTGANDGPLTTDSAGANDRKLQDEATDSQSVFGNKEFYLAVGIAAALFILLAVITCVTVCWCMVRKRRSYKASMRSTSGGRICGKNKYYDRNCQDLRVPDKLEFTEYDETHIYDTVDHLDPSKQNKKGKPLETSFTNSRMLNTPEANAEFSMEDGKYNKSKMATPWPRSKRNDYQDHVLDPFSKPGQNRADPTKWLECSDYEVPVNTMPRNGIKREESECVEYSIPTDQKARTPNVMGRSMMLAKSDLDSSHYDVPCSNSSGQGSTHIGAIQKEGASVKVKSDAEYDVPCHPRISRSVVDNEKEGKQNQEGDDDYTSMDDVWNQPL